MLRRSSLRRRGGADRRMPKSGSSEPEGQLAQRPLRNGACRKAEAVNPKTNPPSGNLRIGACRKAEAVSPKANHRAEESTRRTATPKRCMPKSGSREPEGQPAERQSPKQCVPKSGSSEPEAQLAERPSPKRKRKCQLAERKNQPTERKPDSKRPPRAVKTTQDERSPSAGRSRETRGRRSSADTPTNTIEKRDCDTLRPFEAS